MIFDARFNIVHVLVNFADLVICSQWGNALNYAYLDVVYFGTPLVHNAHLCKDIGYFYNNFDYFEGANILNKIINNHEQNSDYYLKKNREKIMLSLFSMIRMSRMTAVPVLSTPRLLLVKTIFVLAWRLKLFQVKAICLAPLMQVVAL